MKRIRHNCNLKKHGRPRKFTEWAKRPFIREAAKCSGQMRPKLNFLSYMCYAKKHLGITISTAKYSGGRIMMWGCFSSTETVKLVRGNRKVNGVYSLKQP
ncbi:hypothetical protein AMECASPLE_009294 [Ameca splendens]|uniref:Uncharacterized protein n=1 Tax=Ameca splendens TaxID=208324 RepID=A0ABV0Y035_9TELE